MLKYLIPVLSAALIAWGAWTTVEVTTATPRAVFDKHVDDENKRIERIQNRIEDKLDKIQEHLMGD
jgi:hypothetical protein